MVDFIKQNYIIILAIAVFLIFALIGFVVDSSKNKKIKESEENSDEEVSNIVPANEEVPVIENNEEVQTPEQNVQEAKPKIEDNKK
jgi:hypothetical protein